MGSKMLAKVYWKENVLCESSISIFCALAHAKITMSGKHSQILALHIFSCAQNDFRRDIGSGAPHIQQIKSHCLETDELSIVCINSL